MCRRMQGSRPDGRQDLAPRSSPSSIKFPPDHRCRHRPSTQGNVPGKHAHPVRRTRTCCRTPRPGPGPGHRAPAATRSRGGQSPKWPEATTSWRGGGGVALLALLRLTPEPVRSVLLVCRQLAQARLGVGACCTYPPAECLVGCVGPFRGLCSLNIAFAFVSLLTGGGGQMHQGGATAKQHMLYSAMYIPLLQGQFMHTLLLSGGLASCWCCRGLGSRWAVTPVSSALQYT